MHVRRSASWLALLALAVVCLTPGAAHAGRRAYLFTWDTEAVNKGDVEIEQWLWGRILTENGPGAGWIWFSPIYGLTDHIEIAFPWEVVVSPAGTRIADFTAEMRIRAYDVNDEERLVRNLIRIAYQQNFSHPDNAQMMQFTPWVQLNVVTSIGDIKGSHGSLDVGGLLALHFVGTMAFRQTVGLAYTHKIADEWRLTAEYYHELNFGGAPSTVRPVTGENVYNFFAGPSVGFSRGRVWATVGALLGLTPASPRIMPRLLFAIAI